MTQDLKVRKHNWRAVSMYLRQHTAYNFPTKIKLAKEVYFGDRPSTDIEVIFLRILLAPEITDLFLTEINDSFSAENKLQNLYPEMQSIQRQDYFYFGNNSFFNRKEQCIYDTLELDLSEDDLEKQTTHLQKNPKNSISDYLGLAEYRVYFEKCTIADHNQLWRSFPEWENTINCIPNGMPPGNIRIWDKNNLLAFEIANRYPDRFDPKIVKLVKKMHGTFTKSGAPDNLKEFYQNIIREDLDAYMKDSCVGAKGTICVRYDSPDQLDAMLMQMDPITRFPVCGDDWDEKIYNLIAHQGNVRPSTHIINILWGSGIYFYDQKIVDSQTLICTFNVGLSHIKTLRGVSALMYDATDIAKRYKSRKSVAGDECRSEVKLFDNAMVFEGFAGGWSVGVNESKYLVSVDDVPWLRKIAGACSSPAELAEKLLDKKLNRKVLDEIVIKASKDENNY